MKNNGNSFSSSIVAYVIKNDKGVWYYCDVEYWIMTDWSQWGIDMSQENKIIAAEFLKVIDKFRVERNILAQRFQDGKNSPQSFLLLPLLVVDFDKHEFFSHYYDRLLETMVLEGWTGVFGEVLDKIPMFEKYWTETGA